MHIVLLEPNTLLAQTYTTMLAAAGHTVAHAFTEQSAINAADTHTPDIVILELQLAAHSGVEFLHEFRSYPEWQDVPVVVQSNLAPAKLAAAEDGLRRDLGVRAILYKPRTTLQQLLRAVREFAPEGRAAA